MYQNRSLLECVDRDGKVGLRYNFHAGQVQAWRSEKRFVAVIAGARAGKTSFGPLWLHREMARRGPGDYLVAGPSYPLLDKAAAPEVEAFFGRLLRLGSLSRSPLQFSFSPAGCTALWPGRKVERQPRVLFGHADDPDSLEALTAKAAWLDEAGQKRFRLASFEAIRRRLAIDQGRCLITTTPYDLGWLKQKIHDPWETECKAGRTHPDIDVVRFDSTENPAFPREEWEAEQRRLPRWKFDMFFRGRFTRPAGMIYDCFAPDVHVVPRFKIPVDWPRRGGLDFGAVNTAGVLLAQELDSIRRPTGRFFAYREYLPDARRTPQEHADSLKEGEPRLPTFTGGASMEDDWRTRFRAAGIPVGEPPVRDVEAGIDCVYALIKSGRLLILEDLEHLKDELLSYSRVLTAEGVPTEQIDGKSSYHLLDALRYVCTRVSRISLPLEPSTHERNRSLVSQMPDDVFRSD